jgi:hypothetical protein
MKDFFLRLWVNLLDTQPANSLSFYPFAPIGAGGLYTQQIAASLPPPPQDWYLQPDKTAAELLKTCDRLYTYTGKEYTVQ